MYDRHAYKIEERLWRRCPMGWDVNGKGERNTQPGVGRSEYQVLSL